jgi:hypothetical protein
MESQVISPLHQYAKTGLRPWDDGLTNKTAGRHAYFFRVKSSLASASNGWSFPTMNPTREAETYYLKSSFSAVLWSFVVAFNF